MTIFTPELLAQIRAQFTALDDYFSRLDDIEIADAFACVSWSGIVEPGDRVAGALWSTMGARASLESLTAGVSAAQLSERLRDAGAVTEIEHDSLVTELDEALGRWLPRLSERESLAHLERARRVGATVVTPGHELWPSGLLKLGLHAPTALWLRGNKELLSGLERSISIVGARASTGYGEHVTLDICTTLVDQGYSIVSGAAYGIDGMVHRAALAQQGKTLAVLAGGIDRLYPSGHDALLHRIIDDGVIVTELPCGFAPTKWRFLQRNRLIAALTQATVVIEAGSRSGSLNTAHHALDMGIAVGAVPGPVTSASSAGCHRLLRETPAVCVTNAQEIMQLASGDAFDAPAHDDELSQSQQRVIDALSTRTPRSSEKLSELTGMTTKEVSLTLAVLELRSTVRQRESGWIRA